MKMISEKDILAHQYFNKGKPKARYTYYSFWCTESYAIPCKKCAGFGLVTPLHANLVNTVLLPNGHC